MSRTWLLFDSPGQDHTATPHNYCYQGPSADRPFCQDGDLSAFLPSTLHKNVEPHGTADTASLYLVTPDVQECCERLDKAAIVNPAGIRIRWLAECKKDRFGVQEYPA
ncbi:hypothetical protein GWK47_014899 [Chionoecetes opilio]|uniref:Uncharacterized protein n=1 Tax=Chionoecetes opilio TaxID=41210 RepID=A0A8J4XVK2_CHIOP|nr:hypothetical protein GWK47_014899 [Chionoecetes opilio]